jgi:DNA ligase-1
MDIRNFFAGNSDSKPQKLVLNAGSESKLLSVEKNVSENGSKDRENVEYSKETVGGTLLSDIEEETKANCFSEQETIGDITWKHGENVPYAALVSTFESVSLVSGRLEKESLFCRLFKSVILTKPDDLHYIVYLASNSLGPAYEGLELGIGDSLLVKAICEGMLLFLHLFYLIYYYKS